MTTSVQDRQVLTPDRLLFDMQSVGTPQISRDGKRIAYTLSRTERGTANGVSHLWLMDANGGKARQLTQTGSSTSDIAWSPDNASIAFVSRRGGDGFSICVLPLDGGEARTVTSHVEKPGSLAWSPDGTRIAYTVSADPENPDEAPRDKDLPPAVRVIRRIDYKQDNRGFLNDVRHQVMVVDIESGARSQISTEPMDHSFPQWSPDGASISAKIGSMNGIYSQIAIFPINGGEPTRVGWQQGAVGTWAWSQDGAFILFDGFSRPSPQSEYFRYDVAAGETTQLTTDLSFSPESGFPTISSPAQPVWLDESTALLHGVREGAGGLWTINAASGEINEIVRWQAAHSGLSIDDSGTTVVQTCADTNGPGKLVATDLAAVDTTVLLNPNEALFADTPPAQVDRISIDRNGFTIDAWLHKPADFDASRQYPLVVDIHGGPHGHHGFKFNGVAQVLASNGILVVSPNPRGSDTYGRDFAEAVIGDWGGEDWLDILAILDEVESRPWIDSSRTGIYGYSYGGYMTAWAIGQTDRFKVAVCGAPVFNLQSAWGTSDITHIYGEIHWRGGPTEVGEWMRERSPSTHVHKAVTPTLIIHGEADDRCPIGQGEEMFVGLLKAGCETEFVRYPGGSHLINLGGPIQHRVDYLTRVLSWFERYLS